jgi:hypothetical protein
MDYFFSDVLRNLSKGAPSVQDAMEQAGEELKSKTERERLASGASQTNLIVD